MIIVTDRVCILQEPIIKEAALSVLTALLQTNEKVQRQVMKDLEQIGFDNLWERMGLVLIRTPPRPTTLGAAPGAQDPLIARIRYKFTTMFAFLAANSTSDCVESCVHLWLLCESQT